MAAPKKVTYKDIVAESQKLTANASLDSTLQQALTNEEDGFMRPGAMPAVSCASAAGTKQILDAVAKARYFNQCCSKQC